MKIAILPYKRGSKSAKTLSRALDTKLVRLVGSKYRHGADKLIVNWGNNGHDMEPRFHHATMLNRFASVELATNKLDAFRALEEEGVNIPPFTTKYAEAEKWVADGGIAVARTLLRANSGRGIVICDGQGDIPPAPLYVKYIKKTEEYRVHVGSGSVISVQRKARRKDVPDNEVDWKVRNLAGGFIFARNEGNEVPDQVLAESVSAVNALTLDFGAVDVVWNKVSGKAYVLEVNTAPGLEGQTLDDYTRYFKTFL